MHGLQEHPGGGEGGRGRDADAMMTTYPKPAFQKDETRILGHKVTRLEDLPLVTGRGHFAADINFPRQLHMRIARASQAHGRIVHVGADDARTMPGVVAVWT